MVPSCTTVICACDQLDGAAIENTACVCVCLCVCVRDYLERVAASDFCATGHRDDVISLHSQRVVWVRFVCLIQLYIGLFAACLSLQVFCF